MVKVDVIIPCYRYGHFLRECVESVLSQSLRAVRLLIIDDASPDMTPEVGAQLAREDSRVTFIRHQSNLGHVATFNEGIERASAEYLLVLSADDLLMPGALARAAALLDAHPDVGFVFGRCVDWHSGYGRPADDTAVRPYGWQILGSSEFFELSGSRNIVPAATAVVRTGLQKRLGGYRPDLPYAEDLEMWLRFASRGSVGFIDANQAVRRVHESNMSRAFVDLPDLQYRKAAFDHVFDSGTLHMPDAQTLRRTMMQSLAGDAVLVASSSFRRGDIGACECTLEFAVALWPEIRRTWPWMRLAVARRLGHKAFSTLYPILTNLRRGSPALSYPAVPELRTSAQPMVSALRAIPGRQPNMKAKRIEGRDE